MFYSNIICLTINEHGEFKALNFMIARVSRYTNLLRNKCANIMIYILGMVYNGIRSLMLQVLKIIN